MRFLKDKRSKTLFGIALAFLMVFAIFYLLYSPKQVRADITVSTCINITSSGNYILVSDILNNAYYGNNANRKACINITIADVLFDCNGFKMSHLSDTANEIPYTDAIKIEGIVLAKLTNVSVKNCYLLNWSRGINYNYVENSTVENVSSLFNYREDVLLVNSAFMNITNITKKYGTGYNVHGDIRIESSKYINLTNLRNSLIIYRAVNISAYDIINGVDKVGIYASNNSVFSNIFADSFEFGDWSWNNTLINYSNNLSSYSAMTIGYPYGYANYNNLLNITINNCTEYGLLILNSNYTQIINSSFYNNTNGYPAGYGGGVIIGGNSFYTNITGCTFQNNSVGIDFNNPDTGFSGIVQNSLIWNNIFNNTPNGGLNWIMRPENYTNYFNITKIAGKNIYGGTSFGGNYWSDYSFRIDADSDGLGDMPYIINETYMVDWLPLMNPTSPVTIYTYENNTNKSINILNFSWSHSTNNGTYTFVISNNSNFAQSSIWLNKSFQFNNYTMDILENFSDNRYFWKVRINDSIVYSAWSKINSFIVDTQPPNIYINSPNSYDLYNPSAFPFGLVINYSVIHQKEKSWITNISKVYWNASSTDAYGTVTLIDYGSIDVSDFTKINSNQTISFAISSFAAYNFSLYANSSTDPSLYNLKSIILRVESSSSGGGAGGGGGGGEPIPTLNITAIEQNITQAIINQTGYCGDKICQEPRETKYNCIEDCGIKLNIQTLKSNWFIYAIFIASIALIVAYFVFPKPKFIKKYFTLEGKRI